MGRDSGDMPRKASAAAHRKPDAPAPKGRRGGKRPANGNGAIRQRNVAKILSAATSVFAQKGFNGATTGEIAERAGLPKANLHYYFPTKRELYTSVLDEVLSTWLGFLDE